MDDDFVQAEILARFPPGSLLLVEVKRPETDPAWFAATRVVAPPGTLVVRLVPRGPEAYNPHATELPGRGHVPEHVYHAVVDGFSSQHDAALRPLTAEVLAPLAQQVRLGVWYEGYSRTWEVGRTRPAAPPTLPATAPARRAGSATTGSAAASSPAGVTSRQLEDARWPLALSATAAVAALVQFRRRRTAQTRRAAIPTERA